MVVLILHFESSSCHWHFRAGVYDRLCSVDEDTLTNVEASYCTPPVIVLPEFDALAKRIMNDYNMNKPRCFEESPLLYHIIVCILDQAFIAE